jgi:MoaA/NifB/PqqE/SkfB family radical SAM enzyme
MPESGIETIKKNLMDMKKLGVLVMNFTGGEPLLHNDIVEALRVSKRLGFFNILTTSGVAYLEKAEAVTPFIDHLVFSLDSPLPDEHNRVRGVAIYDTVIEGIKKAKSLKKLPLINFTVTRETIGLMPEMVDLAQNLGVLLWINPVYNWPGLEGFERDSLDYILRFAGRRNVAFNHSSLELIRQGGNNVKRPVCKAGEATLTLLPDNRLVAPCFYFQKGAATADNGIPNVLKRREIKLSTSFHGLGDPCRGCMAWEYMNPSFLQGINKYTFKSLRSLWDIFWKELSLKKGVNI